VIFTIVICQIAMAQTNFKVVTYNALGFPNNNNTTSGGTNADRLAAFQDIMESINPDVVILQELKTSTGANNLLNQLNASSLSKTFARTPLAPAANSGEGGNMLFYNTALFSFSSESIIPKTAFMTAPDGTIVSSPRSANMYRLNASGSGGAVPIYFISTHLKAGFNNNASNSSQISDDLRRGLGAKDIMNYVQSNLSSTDNIILVGDMNFQDESDIGYIDFTASASYTESFSDPLGAWQRDSQSSVSKFTQSTRTVGNAVGNGGSSGGLCDRFDFIFYNNDIAAGSNGVGYDANTMQTYGSTGVSVNQSALSGNHPLKQEIYNFASNTVTEDFSGYTGQGFTNDPAPGQLCSYAWDFSGFQDNYVFGGINVGNDYALGSTSGGTSQGGIYANNQRLWVQPTSSDFTSGTIVMKICNQSGSTIDSMNVSFDMLIFYLSIHNVSSQSRIGNGSIPDFPEEYQFIQS